MSGCGPAAAQRPKHQRRHDGPGDRAPARGDPLDDGAGGVAGRGDTLRGFRGDSGDGVGGELGAVQLARRPRPCDDLNATSADKARFIENDAADRQRR